ASTPAGQWTILEGYLKPFAAVRHTHYGVEAALRLRARHAIDADQVAAIRLQVYPEAVQYCHNRAPDSAIQAQFSLSYAIAAALVLGDLGPAAYTNVDDVRITRLEQLVVVEADTTRTRRGANVAIEFAGQHVSDSVDDVAGDPTLPMTRDQVVEKFRRYTEPSIGARRAAALFRFCLDGDPAQPARTCLTLES
ncbi:MAG: MmgE/PrpD family protein, partial [Alphaproteobacteria bacterium]|nr:MmgE/PrpD family protein [Alphaproteobacteria bacterium]